MSASDRLPERPSERRSAARTSVVWDALGPLVAPAEAASGEPGRESAARVLDVIDVGGGTGGFAVRVARLGHRVTVVDPSPDALASLSRRAHELGVQVTGRQGDLSSLLDVVGSAQADLVLCHGVLEVVDDPVAALSVIGEVLRPGGSLSLLVAQRHAAVLARAMAGHFTQARELLDPTAPEAAGRSGRRFTHDEVVDHLDHAGFEVQSVQAVRVFTDLVPGALLDLEPGAAAALVDLERAVAARPEYLPLAAQLHLLAR